VRLSARELAREVAQSKDDLARQIESNNYDGSRLNGYLDENVREILERIRRQK